MTVMTRNAAIAHANETRDIETLKTPDNHGKKWSVDNDDHLKKLADKNIITRTDISNAAIKLGRTYGAVKSRILTYYIQDSFDYNTGDNSKLLKKFQFATEEDIEWYALRNYTKKYKLAYKLNKIERIVNSIKDKSNNGVANDCESILDIIASISEENN
jgi:hypothetical protein